MITEKNIISFVINLDNYEDNYKKQLPYFESIKLSPKRFSAVNAITNQHIKHKKLINLLSFYLAPKSVIGCSLSHILLAKHLYENYGTYKNIFFLVLEDDVFPKNEYLDNSKQFYNDLNNEIENIKIIDKNWDIIQLHSDGLIDTKSTYTTHLFTGSTAAYLISFNGLKKMCNEKVTYHIDFVTQNFLKYRKYRSRTNLFYTNEKSSVNREMNYSKSTILKSALLQKIIPLRGEKIWEDYLSFKSLRIPIINKEFTVNNLFDFGLLFSLFYALKNKKILELTN
tara:strand:+ start:1912 stop:2760 length:849 start_codon:yes stop_codon:yes gene_type:complete